MNSCAPHTRRHWIKWPSKSRHPALNITVASWWADEHDRASNHRCLDCVFNHLFRRKSKKASKLRVTGLCEVNSPVTGEFPAQRASNAENVSIWWCHHYIYIYMKKCSHWVCGCIFSNICRTIEYLRRKTSGKFTKYKPMPKLKHMSVLSLS